VFREEKDYFEPFVEGEMADFLAYVDHKAALGVWGDDPEIQVCWCNLLLTRTRVVNLNDAPRFMSSSSKTNRPCANCTIGLLKFGALIRQLGRGSSAPFTRVCHLRLRGPPCGLVTTAGATMTQWWVVTTHFTFFGLIRALQKTFA
jgi:hypothetical protein